MVVSCSHPVRDKAGNIVAVVCIDLSLSKLHRVSEYLQVYKDSYYSIRSSTGMDIVARPDTMPGRKYRIFDEEIDSTGWHLSIIIPEDVLYADLRRIGLIVTILMLLGLALLVFIMVFAGRNLQNLMDVSTQRERMIRELEIAKTIQKAMLPKIFPPFADRSDLNIYGMVRPAKEIGGDLYDFYVRHDKLFFCVGDVSGKGVPASLVMATIRSLFRSITAHVEQAHEVLIQMNDTLTEQNDQNMFVTLFVGILDLKTGELSYCNAGHNAPLIIRGEQAEVRTMEVQANLPVGISLGYSYVEQKMHLTYGDTLFLYTDGLTEAENIRHEQFGEQRMEKALNASLALRPREIVDAMDAQVTAFVGGAEQSDDLTLMAVRYQKPAIIMRNDIQQIPTLAEWVDELGIPMELNMPINLALEEAVSNVMLYAYPGRNDGKVFVEFAKAKDEQGEKLIFTISDSGIPFDPTAKPEADITLSAEERAIGGLGIHLVRKLMDEIRYERQDGKNILTLVKILNQKS
jgi:sigma-B regulation protein RsbU (phosphoserine phosphatase)